MSDSDGSPQRGDRHHTRSRSRSPVFPGCAGEIPAEREERQLVVTEVPLGPSGGQPQAAPSDTEFPTPDPAPAGEAAPAAQTAAPTAPPPEKPRMRRGPRQPLWPAMPRPPAHRRHEGLGPARNPGTSPGTAIAAAACREGTKYRAHNKPIHTQTSPPKLYPPKAAFPEGRPRPVGPLMPKHTPPGVTLPPLRRRRVEEGGGGHGGGGGVADGSRGRLASGGGGQAPGKGAGASSSAGGQTQNARRDGREQGHRQGGDVSPRGQAGRGAGTGGGRKGGGQGKAGREPPQPEVQAVRAIPPGMVQMPAHHHCQSLYTIDSNMGDLIPPQPPLPPRQLPPPPTGPHPA